MNPDPRAESTEAPVRRALTVLLFGLALPAAVNALEIVRSTLVPATRSAGADFVLQGTAGQPAIEVAEAAGLRLQGGFHRGAAGSDQVFADGFESVSSPSITQHSTTTGEFE